jgi:TolB-like protein
MNQVPLTIGPFHVDATARRVEGPLGAIELSARSFDILCALLARPGEVVSKEQLLEAAWPGVIVEENTLHVHMSALRKALPADMIVTVHGRGYKYAGPPPGREVPSIQAQAKKPVIAVLPFDNQSGDPGQQYFSDGITEDITDRLTRFRALAVIGKHSAFRFRGNAPDFGAIRDTLKADFVVTGSIRRSDSRIRIAARLSDATNETAIWAEHYDRPIAGLFDLQDEIANLLAATIARMLEVEIAARVGGRSSVKLKSYELVLRGQWHFDQFTRSGNEEAFACFTRAVESDPHNAYALAWLAQSHINRWCTDFSDHDLRYGVELAAQAVKIDPSDARCFLTCGWGQLWTHGLETAKGSLDQAIALNPSETDALADRALASAFECETAEARNWLARAAALNPIPPACCDETKGVVEFVENRYSEALPGFEMFPDGAWEMMYALACYGHLGQKDKVQAVLERFESEGRKPDFLAAAAREPFREPEVRDRLVAGLKLAFSF